MGSAPLRVGFGDVLRIRSFLAMYLAETQSDLGDQIARVALSVLVYQRTGSTVLTALTYALTFLPAILGGALLSGIADRYSRKWVMVSVDTLRAALIAAMALRHVPNVLLLVLLAVAVFLGPAFTSAEVSLIASIMDAEHYRVATGLRMITNQIAQVTGFAVGGVMVAAIGSHATLAVDAATFALSALIVGAGVRRASAAEAAAGRHREPDSPPLSLGASLRALWGDPRLRILLGLSWLAGFFVAPEGLAAPYAKALGESTAAVGALLAAIPLGAVVGAFVVLRAFGPAQRQAALGPMAALAGAPLVLCAINPPLGIVLALWFGSGLFAAYQLDAITTFVQLVDESWRGRAVGVVAAGLTTAQGIGLVAFGLVASATDPGTAIGAAGLIGSVCALGLWAAWQRANRPGPEEANRHQKLSRVNNTVGSDKNTLTAILPSTPGETLISEQGRQHRRS